MKNIFASLSYYETIVDVTALNAMVVIAWS